MRKFMIQLGINLCSTWWKD